MHLVTVLCIACQTHSRIKNILILVDLVWVGSLTHSRHVDSGLMAEHGRVVDVILISTLCSLQKPEAEVRRAADGRREPVQETDDLH